MTILPLLAALALAGGSIKHAEGDVRVAGKRVAAGQALKDGDVVTTKKGASAVVELEDGTLLKLRAGSALTVRSANEAGLESGGVFAKVFKPGFRLRAAGAVAAVRGTEFFTAFGRKKDVWLCVNEGKVDVSAGNGSALVPAGQGILIPGGKKPTEPKPYEWTKGLNWNMDPQSGPVADSTSLDAAYSDLLDQDYR